MPFTCFILVHSQKNLIRYSHYHDPSCKNEKTETKCGWWVSSLPVVITLVCSETGLWTHVAWHQRLLFNNTTHPASRGDMGGIYTNSFLMPTRIIPRPIEKDRKDTLAQPLSSAKLAMLPVEKRRSVSKHSLSFWENWILAHLFRKPVTNVRMAK